MADRSFFKLKPAYKDYIWGGGRLKAEYGKTDGPDVIAESWELSCNPHGLSRVGDSDETLLDWIAAHPCAVGRACGRGPGAGGGEFPILVKLIDAATDLSVQVHPDDAYARARGMNGGKTEMWYIADCEEGASLYLGFSREVTRDEVAGAARAGTLEGLLRRVRVHPGDAYFVPAGTVHAIGKGNLIVEVQQNSDVTYRLYDYERTDLLGNKRPLHVDEGLEVATLTASRVSPLDRTLTCEAHGRRETILAACPYFTLCETELDGDWIVRAQAECFETVVLLNGSLEMRSDEGRLVLKKGDSAFITAGADSYVMSGERAMYLRAFGADVRGFI
jgi:mannose-6-phosphate isomerase